MKRKQVKFAKKLMSVVLSLVMAMGTFGLFASAAGIDVDSSGTFGDGLVWYYSTGKCELRIIGNGSMGDGFGSTVEIPWYGIMKGVYKLVIEEGVTDIADNAFMNFEHLDEVTIPASVKKIGKNPFRGCDSLKTITVDPDNEYYFVDSNGVLFSKDMSELVIYPCSKEETSYYIPSGVQKIADLAFHYSKLQYVHIPYGVTTIGDHAFSYSPISDVVFPETLTSIGTSAFSRCAKMTSVEIPESIEYVGNTAFYSCSNVDKISLPDKVFTIGSDAFTSTKFYDDTENWEDGALYIGKHLVDVYRDAPDRFITKFGTLTVANGAFDFPLGPKEVLIGGTVKYIGSSAFEGNLGIEKVVIGPSVEKIGGSAFSDSDVENVIICEGVQEIGSFAFSGSEAIKSVTIPSTVSVLERFTFFGAGELESVTLYNTLTKIDAGTFTLADSLTDIYFYGTEDDWDSIDKHATVDNSLEDVTIHYLGAGHTHVYDETSWVFEPACEYQGYTFEVCDCGAVKLGEVYDALGHDFGKWTVTTAPTETTKGVETRYCSRCVATETRELDVIEHAHDYNPVVVESTCTEGGFTKYICSSCGDSYMGEETAILGHLYGDWVVIQEPTETQGGLRACYCRRCGHEKTRSIPSTGHKHEYTETVTFPTCTTEGYTTYTCECGDSYTGDVVREHGHRFGEWVVVKMPSATEDGLKIRECKSCDEVETCVVTVETHDHIFNADDTIIVQPTCTDPGYMTFVCACGYTVEDIFVSSLGHNYGDWVVIKEPTQTEYGQREHTCGRCGRVETATIGKLPATTDEALIKVDQAKARPGETVEVTVSLENNPGIVATHLMLNYNSDILTLTEVRDGGLIGTGKMVAGKDLTDIPYNVIWSDALAEENHADDGVLVTFVFTVAENAPEGVVPVTVTYYAESTFNTDLDEVEFKVINGSVEVTHRIAGDANGDGLVNLKDTVVIERYLAGGWGVTVDAVSADVNGDGKVSLIDSVLINRYLADWDVKLI